MSVDPVHVGAVGGGDRVGLGHRRRRCGPGSRATAGASSASTWPARRSRPTSLLRRAGPRPSPACWSSRRWSGRVERSRGGGLCGARSPDRATRPVRVGQLFRRGCGARRPARPRWPPAAPSRPSPSARNFDLGHADARSSRRRAHGDADDGQRRVGCRRVLDGPTVTPSRRSRSVAPCRRGPRSGPSRHVRLDLVAPGPVHPLLPQGTLDDPVLGPPVGLLPVPLGRPVEPAGSRSQSCSCCRRRPP